MDSSAIDRKEDWELSWEEAKKVMCNEVERAIRVKFEEFKNQLHRVEWMLMLITCVCYFCILTFKSTFWVKSILTIKSSLSVNAEMWQFSFHFAYEFIQAICQAYLQFRTQIA